MKIGTTAYRSVWVDPADNGSVRIIDQTALPWSLAVGELQELGDAAHAIRSMQVRGAPLIGAVAAYGLALALRRDSSTEAMEDAARVLAATRPTAINLRWALDRMLIRLRNTAPPDRAAAAYAEAGLIADEDVAQNRAIGGHGLPLIEAVAAARPGAVNVLTHCNAGWLATVDWGTALAPIYTAHDAGIPVHVWVDETRPRNQGAFLTAWELGEHGVPHTVIADNVGGHLMQHGKVDLAIVGTDRVTREGDVANKIGTYLKALAARDNSVPFWVACPSSTIDWTVSDGLREIPIEQRDAAEVATVTGQAMDGRVTTVRVMPPGSPAANPAFDITPARLVTGLITERGLCGATATGLRGLFPEQVPAAGGRPEGRCTPRHIRGSPGPGLAVVCGLGQRCTMTIEQIEASILALTAARGPEKSICPSEVARALQAEGWQSLLTPVREAAKRLVTTGQIDILRKGKKVQPGEVRGVIRLRQRVAS